MSSSSLPIAPDSHVESTKPAAITIDEPFSRRDWAVVGLAIIEAALWAIVLDPCDMLDSNELIPGLGITILAFVGFACAYALTGKSLRLTPATVLLNAASFLLALSFTLFADPDLRFLNCIALWIVGTYTIFLTTGIWQHSWASLRALAASAGFFFTSLFSNLTRPLKAADTFLSNRRKAEPQARRKLPKGAGLGIVLAAAVLIVVMPLLASADMVFGSAFEAVPEAFGQWLRELDLFRICCNLAMFFTFGPFLFALLYVTEHRSYTESAPPKPDWPQQVEPITVSIVLAVVDAVYLLFVIVQIVYLFGGSEAPAMHGGYAEYARRGFFQLVAVSVINVVLGLVAAKCSAAHEQGRCVLRVLTVLLVALASVILVSAAWRMQLYIGEYGLSKLRLGTLFIMAFCAVLFIAVLVKLFAAKTGFYRVFFVAGLTLWLAFNYINPNAFVANHNVDAYLNDDLERIDVEYLYTLGPEGKTALRRLTQDQPHAGDFAEFESKSWQYWNLSSQMNR